jgi:Domain of unknown function DUF29
MTDITKNSDEELIMTINKFAELYEHDFNAWIHNQISLLKEGKTGEIDVEHFIEQSKNSVNFCFTELIYGLSQSI